MTILLGIIYLILALISGLIVGAGIINKNAIVVIQGILLMIFIFILAGRLEG